MQTRRACSSSTRNSAWPVQKQSHALRSTSSQELARSNARADRFVRVLRSVRLAASITSSARAIDPISTKSAKCGFELTVLDQNGRGELCQCVRRGVSEVRARQRLHTLPYEAVRFEHFGRSSSHSAQQAAFNQRIELIARHRFPPMLQRSVASSAVTKAVCNSNSRRRLRHALDQLRQQVRMNTFNRFDAERASRIRAAQQFAGQHQCAGMAASQSGDTFGLRLVDSQRCGHSLAFVEIEMQIGVVQQSAVVAQRSNRRTQSAQPIEKRREARCHSLSRPRPLRQALAALSSFAMRCTSSRYKQRRLR